MPEEATVETVPQKGNDAALERDIDQLEELIQRVGKLLIQLEQPSDSNTELALRGRIWLARDRLQKFETDQTLFSTL